MLGKARPLLENSRDFWYNNDMQPVMELIHV